uniref:GG11839 n=1 Tax=Drosophila erecta TaxID=7220 RepID=B3P256_DROER
MKGLHKRSSGQSIQSREEPQVTSTSTQSIQSRGEPQVHEYNHDQSVWPHEEPYEYGDSQTEIRTSKKSGRTRETQEDGPCKCNKTRSGGWSGLTDDTPPHHNILSPKPTHGTIVEDTAERRRVSGVIGRSRWSELTDDTPSRHYILSPKPNQGTTVEDAAGQRRTPGSVQEPGTVRRVGGVSGRSRWAWEERQLDPTGDTPLHHNILSPIRAGTEVQLTGAEGLVRILSFTSIMEASGGRSERQEVEHGRREGSRSRRDLQRYDGHEKPLEFLEQVEWSAMTYGLDINQIPRAMPKLLKGRALKWFIANNRFWETWAEFIQSFQEIFLLRGFMTKLADQVKQRKQRHGEGFKDYMVNMQTLMRPLGLSRRETLERIRENSTPALRMFVRPYGCRDLDALMVLADEFEELDTQRERFEVERTHWARHQRDLPRGEQNAVCRRCQEDTTGTAGHTIIRQGPDSMRKPGSLDAEVQEPADQFLLGLREDCPEDRGVLFEIGKRHATPASEGQPGFARCRPSKLMGKLKAEERQLSATVLIDGVEAKATMDTGRWIRW